MQRPRFSYRILLVIWACVLAFGLGVEGSRAAVLYDSCSRICNRRCQGHGGCDTYWPSGCDCYYECADGHDGSVLCTE